MATATTDKKRTWFFGFSYSLLIKHVYSIFTAMIRYYMFVPYSWDKMRQGEKRSDQFTFIRGTSLSHLCINEIHIFAGINITACAS